MEYAVLFLYGIVSLYVLLILLFLIGWWHTNDFYPSDKPNKTRISVIIPVRNEAENIRFLLNDLIAQTHHESEIIFIDDHSEDDTASIIKDYISLFPYITLFAAINNGKKHAVNQGISVAKGELIALVDGDCRLSPDWMKTIVDFYESNPSNLIIGPVRLQSGKTVFSQIQALEFLSLSASAAGSCGIHTPILCNGCNLVFPKKTWIASFQEIKTDVQSGDDMFLMSAVKKRKGTVSFLKSEFAIVSARGSESISSFFNQRKRWVSKSKSYTDYQVILAGLLVALTAVSLLLLGLMSIFNPEYFNPFIYCFGMKFIIDLLFLCNVVPFYRQQKLLTWFFPVACLYPCYVLLSLIGGLFGTFNWKGRTNK